MATRILKSIAFMLMVVCGSVSANAENVNELNPAVEEAQVSNLNEAVESAEGIPADSLTLVSIHQKCAEARAWFDACQVNEYDYDVRYYDVKNRKTGELIDQCPIQWGRKNGLSVRAFGAYEYNTAGKHNFGGGAGVWMQNRHYALEANLGLTTYVYNSNAREPGDREKMLFGEGAVYWSIPLDGYAQWRIHVGAGLHLTHYKTESKITTDEVGTLDYRSWGNSLKPMASLMLTYRPFASRLNISAGVRAYETPSVFQNADTKNRVTVRGEIGISWNLGASKAFQRIKF